MSTHYQNAYIHVIFSRNLHNSNKKGYYVTSEFLKLASSGICPCQTLSVLPLPLQLVNNIVTSLMTIIQHSIW